MSENIELKKALSVSNKYPPIPLQQPEIVKTKSVHGSAWNFSGTWEEKKLEIAKLKEYLNTKMTLFHTTKWQSLIVEGLSGEASVVFSKGKIKIGFELDGTIRMEIAKDVSAVLTLRDFSDASNDSEVVM